MKINRIILVAVLVMSGWITSAQSQFDKFEDIDGVTSVVVTQKAFSLMSKIGSESDEEYMELIKNIESLRVFATESAEVALQMEKAAASYLKSANLEKLMTVKEEGSNIAIYVREGKSEDYVKELFMFVKDSEKTSQESVIISLTGDINLNQIAKLTEKMNLPGGEHLEKASKQ